MSVPSVDSIRRRVGGSSFERGQRYARAGHIHDARRQGNILKARCQGSYDNEYRVQVELNGAKIVAGQCTCPVGEGGYCKHVAALLLSLREHPDDFEPIEPLERLLGKRSKDELIEVIRTLLEAEPDLEELVESAAAGATAEGQISAQSVERSVATVLRRDGYGPSYEREVATFVKARLAIAGQRLQHRDYANAAAVAEGILAAMTAQYESISDETGAIAAAATGAAEMLGECFAKLRPGEAHREAALAALFALLRFDVEFGGIGISDGVPDVIARHATPDERRQVIAWIRETVGEAAGHEGFNSNWRRECWGALIADLAGEEMPLEEYLAHCREFGLFEALIAELLKRKRFDEAREAALDVADYRLPAIADMFVKHRRAADAEAVMQARAGDNGRSQASEWLVHFYEQNGRWDDALEWRLRWFKSHPGLEPYREVRRAAKKAGRWAELHDELLAQVRATGDPHVEIPILLEEKRCDELLQLLDAWRQSKRRIGRDTLLDVARAIGKKHPEQALEIYLQQAELAMQGRQRGSYAEACDLLRRARDIYKATGRDAEWRACVEGIAAENRKLRAFQDELRRARLLPK